MKMTTVILAAVLVFLLGLVGITSSAPYDPWCDLDDDGDIDIFDIVKMAGAYGTSGTPINKTELLLELAARMDALNASVLSLEEQIALLDEGAGVEVGRFDGEVNSDMVEKEAATVINFESPFTGVDPPEMVVFVVLKQAANGLWEGAAIKAVEGIKGAPGNWYGFDLTVSKYSDGTSIDDLTKVFVSWIAIGTSSTSGTQVYADLFGDSTDASGYLRIDYPAGIFTRPPHLSITAWFSSGGLGQMAHVTILQNTKDNCTIYLRDGNGSPLSSHSVQISYTAVENKTA